MPTVKEIYQVLCDIAPLELQMKFDNSGLLLGRENAPVSKVLLSLDITEDVIDEAARVRPQLIVSHHPLIFDPIRALTEASLSGKKALRLAELGIAAICMHTNLDIAQGGVNDVLMEKLGAQVLVPLDREGCGRVGLLEEEMPLTVFLALVKERLQVNALRYVDGGKPVKKLAVLGGSGGSELMDAVRMGCETFVTADVKYHQFLDARELGVNLIDADHFCTEAPIIPELARRLGEIFPDLELCVSQVHRQQILVF